MKSDCFLFMSKFRKPVHGVGHDERQPLLHHLDGPSVSSLSSYTLHIFSSCNTNNNNNTGLFSFHFKIALFLLGCDGKHRGSKVYLSLIIINS